MVEERLYAALRDASDLYERYRGTEMQQYYQGRLQGLLHAYLIVTGLSEQSVRDRLAGDRGRR